ITHVWPPFGLGPGPTTVSSYERPLAVVCIAAAYRCTIASGSMNAKRLVVICLVMASSRIASATVTETPDPLDAGDVLVGAMGTSAQGTLHDALGSTV